MGAAMAGAALSEETAHELTDALVERNRIDRRRKLHPFRTALIVVTVGGSMGWSQVRVNTAATAVDRSAVELQAQRMLFQQATTQANQAHADAEAKARAEQDARFRSAIHCMRNAVESRLGPTPADAACNPPLP